MTKTEKIVTGALVVGGLGVVAWLIFRSSTANAAEGPAAPDMGGKVEWGPPPSSFSAGEAVKRFAGGVGRKREKFASTPSNEPKASTYVKAGTAIRELGGVVAERAFKPLNGTRSMTAAPVGADGRSSNTPSSGPVTWTATPPKAAPSAYTTTKPTSTTYTAAKSLSGSKKVWS